MDNGQELADVVGGIWKRPLSEQFHARGHIHTAVLHHPGIARTSPVHSDAVAHDTRNGLVVDHLVRTARDSPEDVHLARVVAERLDGLLLGVECLVACPGKALDTQLTLGPRVADAGLGALPHHIPFAFVGCHEVAYFGCLNGQSYIIFPTSTKSAATQQIIGHSSGRVNGNLLTLHVKTNSC